VEDAVEEQRVEMDVQGWRSRIPTARRGCRIGARGDAGS
jgi:hypothetical protein